MDGWMGAIRLASLFALSLIFCDAMQCTALRCNALRCAALRCNALRCAALFFLPALPCACMCLCVCVCGHESPRPEKDMGRRILKRKRRSSKQLCI